MKWKPDYDTAASEYAKAGTAHFLYSCDFIHGPALFLGYKKNNIFPSWVKHIRSF